MLTFCFQIRILEVPESCNGVARFTFDYLCGRPVVCLPWHLYVVLYIPFDLFIFFTFYFRCTLEKRERIITMSIWHGSLPGKLLVLWSFETNIQHFLSMRSTSSCELWEQLTRYFVSVIHSKYGKESQCLIVYCEAYIICCLLTNAILRAFCKSTTLLH